MMNREHPEVILRRKADEKRAQERAPLEIERTARAVANEPIDLDFVRF